MKKIAVVLSGCGFKDGAEITESVSTLIHLSELGVEYSVFAPSLEVETVNHVDNQTQGLRNILSESARISRGVVSDLSLLAEKDFDALVFPGGYGAALHLCNWAQKGSQCEVLPQVNKLILDFHRQSKPIGAICISPVLVARVLGSHGVTLTIGEDAETAQEIEKTGAAHVNCLVEDYVTDRENKIISTPAYMYNAKPHQVYKGVGGLIREIVEMA